MRTLANSAMNCPALIAILTIRRALIRVFNEPASSNRQIFGKNIPNLLKNINAFTETVLIGAQ